MIKYIKKYYIIHYTMTDKTIDNTLDNVVDNNMTKVYIDGACSNNGRDNSKAGYGIWFSYNDKRNENGRVIGSQTNNTAELTAFIRCVEIGKKDLDIYTDSEYVMKCINKYGEKREKDNWVKDFPNKELVKKAYYLFKESENIKINYIKAHTGNEDDNSKGNNEADKLAVESIGGTQSTIIELDISFENKDMAKSLGARWEVNNKYWYCDTSKLDKDSVKKLIELSKPDDNKVNIKIPFSNKDTAKSLGCKWDAKIKSWYYMKNFDKTVIDKIIKLSS